MKIGVDGRTFTVKEPGGAVGVALKHAELISQKHPSTTVFGHKSLEESFQDVNSDWYSIDSMPFGLCWEQVLLPRIADKNDIDVLYCPNNYCPLRETEFKKVVAIQGTHSFHEFGGGWYNRFRNKILPRVVDQADHIITVSEFSKSDIIEYLNVDSSKVSVVYNGIDDLYLSDEPSHAEVDISSPYLLYVGALSSRKNIQGIIKSFEILKKKHDIPHKLVLVGPSSNSTYELLDPLELSSYVKDVIITTGYLTKEGVKHMYTNSDVFLFPSKQEGFGLPPLEAMACGTPVVASKAGALEEVLDNAPCYVDPDSPRDISQGIMKILQDDDYREHLINLGHHRAAQFSWDTIGDEIIKVLRSVEN